MWAVGNMASVSDQESSQPIIEAILAQSCILDCSARFIF